MRECLVRGLDVEVEPHAAAPLLDIQLHVGHLHETKHRCDGHATTCSTVHFTMLCSGRSGTMFDSANSTHRHELLVCDGLPGHGALPEAGLQVVLGVRAVHRDAGGEPHGVPHDIARDGAHKLVWNCDRHAARRCCGSAALLPLLLPLTPLVTLCSVTVCSRHCCCWRLRRTPASSCSQGPRHLPAVATTQAVARNHKRLRQASDHAEMDPKVCFSSSTQRLAAKVHIGWAVAHDATCRIGTKTDHITEQTGRAPMHAAQSSNEQCSYCCKATRLSVHAMHMSNTRDCQSTAESWLTSADVGLMGDAAHTDGRHAL